MLLLENSADSFLQHALALEYIKLDRDKEAEAIFVLLLEKNPDYFGSYYHLAKLLERIGETDKAIEVYKRGMEKTKALFENHAYNELRSAYEELIF